MVFVTSRNATAAVAKRLIEIAQEKGTLHLFEPEKGIKINRTGYKNSDLGYLIPQGFGIHHAGNLLMTSNLVCKDYSFHRNGEE